MVLSTIARCLARGDVVLAKRLIAGSRTAARHLGLNGDKLFLHDPVAFERDVCLARSQNLEKQILNLQEQEDCENAISVGISNVADDGACSTNGSSLGSMGRHQ
eukprot:3154623-Karenia_brevis.AAC.1